MNNIQRRMEKNKAKAKEQGRATQTVVVSSPVKTEIEKLEEKKRFIPDIKSVVSEDIKSMKVVDVEINKIIESFDYQARLDFDDITIGKISTSMSKDGFLQNIILVKIEKGYKIVAGETRVKSAKEAGFKVVPAIVLPVDTDMKKLIRISFGENGNRKSVSDFGLYIQFEKMLDDRLAKTHKELSQLCGGVVSEDMVRKIMSLKKIDKRIYEDVKNKKFSNTLIINRITQTVKKISKLMDKINVKNSPNYVSAFSEEVQKEIYSKHIMDAYETIKLHNLSQSKANALLNQVYDKAEREITKGEQSNKEQGFSIDTKGNEINISINDLTPEKTLRLKSIIEKAIKKELNIFD